MAIFIGISPRVESQGHLTIKPTEILHRRIIATRVPFPFLFTAWPIIHPNESGVDLEARDEDEASNSGSGVTGLLLVVMLSFEAHAGLWCPTPIPGVLMKYCLCESITGRAEVSSPTPLSPLTLFGLRRDLNATAMVDWAGRVQVRGGKRKFLSSRWTLACDRERDCTTTRTVAGGTVVYKYACYAKARPAPCFPTRYC